MSRSLTFLFTALLIAGAWLAIATQLDLLPMSVESFLKANEEKFVELLTVFEREVITPPPLRWPFDSPAGTLTREGVLRETNQHRAKEGLPSLIADDLLNKVAQQKIDDMVTRQYFEHVAPDGTGPADIVEKVGYAYIRVGENLALGNFANNAELVQAWMDSPGHRANILSSGFTELGVAVSQSTFESRQTWLAVQTFGLPVSVCSLPDKILRSQFEEREANVEQFNSALAIKRETLEVQTAQLQAHAQEIEQLTEQGNAKIKEGNRKIEAGNRIYQQTRSREQAEPYGNEGKRLQAEGQVLVEQAQEKNTSLKEQQYQLRSQQQAFNETIDKSNSLGNELAALARQLNKQIRGYNSCVERYR